MKNFALIGAAGYVAPRHLKAIKESGNQLIAAMDIFDSVGIMDSYFPEASFFTEFERFDRHIDKLRRKGQKVDFISICTPNYLHDAHIRFALRNQADVICEKPLVLNPWNVTALEEIEQESNQKVYNILQLRHHSSIIKLKKKIESSPNNQIHEVDLVYITSRGKWYQHSWKGNIEKSGGVATNIGIHFFDMLIWLFGSVKRNIVQLHNKQAAAGYLDLERARVRWFLSTDYEDLPKTVKEKGVRTFRSITIDKEEIEFSNGFTDLHTVSYQEILRNKGFRIGETKEAIELVHQIRNATPVGLKGDYTPYALEKTTASILKNQKVTL